MAAQTAANSIADPHPRRIAVAAGKGGTGKTLIATSLAQALAAQSRGPVQLLDCDVEAPNAHLLLRPRIQSEQPVNILAPEVDLERCTACGVCARTCQTSAIAVIRSAVITFPDLCTGCGACAFACPAGSIRETPRRVGVVSSGATASGLLYCGGCLQVGHQRAGPVIGAVKAGMDPGALIIIDAPPGTACPMQESVAGSDYCIMVTEPTPFGLSDLRAAVETCRAMEVPCGVVLNRDGVGDSEPIEAYCEEAGLPLLLRIPLSRQIAEAYSRGVTLTDAFPERVLPLTMAYDMIAQSLRTHQKER